ncbi:MAG: glycosyltransferase family 9 protein, partial [Massilia sp.]|nr:glycosyltransferase family 9 protein [Massilia sp.]
MSRPTCPPLDDVRKIVVLRPSAVGDFVFALPALQALKQAWPQAELVLAGKAWQRTFLRGRAGPVDRVVAVPPVRGVGASAEMEADTAAVERFV